jgi:hypothetical protein
MSETVYDTPWVEREAEEPECEWCGVVVEDGASAYAPFCSQECREDAETREQAMRELWAARRAEERGELCPDCWRQTKNCWCTPEGVRKYLAEAEAGRGGK